MVIFDSKTIKRYRRRLIGRAVLLAAILIATLIFEIALGMVGLVKDLIDGVEYAESMTGEQINERAEARDRYLYCYIDRLTVLCCFENALNLHYGRYNEKYLVKYTDSEGKTVYTTLNTFGLEETDSELLEKLEDHFRFGAEDPEPMTVSGCFMLFNYSMPSGFDTLYEKASETEQGFPIGHHLTYEYPDITAYHAANTAPYLFISVYLAEVTVLLYFIVKNVMEAVRVTKKLKSITADYYLPDKKRLLSLIMESHGEIAQYRGGIIISLTAISVGLMIFNLLLGALNWQILMLTSAVMLTVLCIYLLTDVKRKKLFDSIKEKEQQALTEGIFVDIPDMQIADIYLGRDALYCKKKKWFIPYSSIVWVYNTYRRTGPYGMIDEYVLYICTDDGIRRYVYSDKYEHSTLLNRLKRFDFHREYTKELDKSFKKYAKEKKKERREANKH